MFFVCLRCATCLLAHNCYFWPESWFIRRIVPPNNHFDGSVQDRWNWSGLAMELRLSCTNPSIWCSPRVAGICKTFYGGQTIRYPVNPYVKRKILFEKNKQKESHSMKLNRLQWILIIVSELRSHPVGHKLKHTKLVLDISFIMLAVSCVWVLSNVWYVYQCHIWGTWIITSNKPGKTFVNKMKFRNIWYLIYTL